MHLRRRRARQLCESSQSTPLQSGPIPGYIAGINRRFAELGEEWQPGRRRDPQPRLLRRLAPARRRRSSCPSSTAASSSASRRRPRTTSTSARSRRAAAGSSTRPTRTPRGCSSTRSRSRRRAAATTWIWQILRDNCRARAARRRRHGGAGRRRRRSAPERFVELIDRYGLETVRAASEDLMDYSERMLRREIEKLPDGTLRGRGPHRRLPDHPNPAYRDLRIKVAVTVEGSEIHVDLTGTAPQVDLPINMPLVGTVDIAICVTLRSILLDASATTRCRRTPASSGRSRSSAPEGCIANPTLPGADDRALLRRATSSPTRSCARSRRVLPERRQRRRRQPQGRRVLRASRRRPALGLHGHPGGELRRPPRQGRARRRRHALREHAQQPDRGHRVALPAARDAVRAASRTGAAPGRWRGGLGTIREIEFLDDGRLLARGRRHRVRAARPVRRRRRDARRGACSTAARRRTSVAAAVEVPVPQGGDGRPALPDRRRAAAATATRSSATPTAIRADIADGYVSRESARALSPR